jgi:hypothetical protein
VHYLPSSVVAKRLERAVKKWLLVPDGDKAAEVPGETHVQDRKEPPFIARRLESLVRLARAECWSNPQKQLVVKVEPAFQQHIDTAWVRDMPAHVRVYNVGPRKRKDTPAIQSADGP